MLFPEQPYASGQEGPCSLNKHHPEALLRWKGLAGATSVNWVTSNILWLRDLTSGIIGDRATGILPCCWLRISPECLAPEQNAAVRVLRPDRWECSTPESPSPDYSHHSTAHRLHWQKEKNKCSCYINIWRLAIASTTLWQEAILQSCCHLCLPRITQKYLTNYLKPAFFDKKLADDCCVTNHLMKCSANNFHHQLGI